MNYIQTAAIKPRRFGSAAEVITRTIYQAGGPKLVAHRLGRSRSTVSSYADPNEPQRMTYAQVRELVRAGALAPVEDLCSLAHGAFMPHAPTDESLSELLAKSACSHGDLVSKAMRATARMSAREALEILKAIEDSARLLLQARARVLADIEAG